MAALSALVPSTHKWNRAMILLVVTILAACACAIDATSSDASGAPTTANVVAALTETPSVAGINMGTGEPSVPPTLVMSPWFYATEVPTTMPTTQQQPLAGSVPTAAPAAHPAQTVTAKPTNDDQFTPKSSNALRGSAGSSGTPMPTTASTSNSRSFSSDAVGAHSRKNSNSNSTSTTAPAVMNDATSKTEPKKSTTVLFMVLLVVGFTTTMIVIIMAAFRKNKREQIADAWRKALYEQRQEQAQAQMRAQAQIQVQAQAKVQGQVHHPQARRPTVLTMLQQDSSREVTSTPQRTMYYLTSPQPVVHDMISPDSILGESLSPGYSLHEDIVSEFSPTSTCNYEVDNRATSAQEREWSLSSSSFHIARDTTYSTSSSESRITVYSVHDSEYSMACV